ncbi:MAG: class I SAM-dependent methyltransferase [Myxococcota bacterium]
MADRGGPNLWFFDLWSRVYDAPLVQRLTYRPVQDAVLRRLREAPPGRMLDVGCGTGLFARRAHGALRRAEVVGCDFSHGMLRRAARNGPGMPWVRGDALHLPFRDGSFDSVVSTEAFHWFPDQEAALRGFFRVLAPKGRLLLALVNPPAEWLSRATRAGSHLLGEPLSWPTRARLRRQVEAAGFRIETQQAVFRLPAPFLLPCVLTVAERPG